MELEKGLGGGRTWVKRGDRRARKNEGQSDRGRGRGTLDKERGDTETDKNCKAEGWRGGGSGP